MLYFPLTASSLRVRTILGYCQSWWGRITLQVPQWFTFISEHRDTCAYHQWNGKPRFNSFPK